MIHIFINALAASSGGGLTYVRNVLPCLAVRDDVRTTVLLSGALRGEIAESARTTVLQSPSPASSGRRFWYEQRNLHCTLRLTFCAIYETGATIGCGWTLK